MPHKGSQGNPIRPIKEDQGLFGVAKAYWEDCGFPSLGSNALFDSKGLVVSMEMVSEASKGPDTALIRHNSP